MTTVLPGFRAEISFLLKCHKKKGEVTDEVVQLSSSMCHSLKMMTFGINIMFDPCINIEYRHETNNKKWDSLYIVQITSTDEKIDTAKKIAKLIKEFVSENHNVSRKTNSNIILNIENEIDRLSENNILELKKKYKNKGKQFKYFDELRNISKLKEISKVISFNINTFYNIIIDNSSSKVNNKGSDFGELGKTKDLFKPEIGNEPKKIDSNNRNQNEDDEIESEKCHKLETLNFRPMFLLPGKTSGPTKESAHYDLQCFLNDDPVGLTFENARANQKFCESLNKALEGTLVSAATSSDISGKYYRVHDVIQGDEETIP